MNILFKQPFLNPFDSRYFEKNDNNYYQSYSPYFYQLAQLEQNQPEQTNLKTKKSITLEIQSSSEALQAVFIKDFLQFFASPVQYYCQRILKLEKRKNLQTLKIYENYYWDSLKFYLFAKKWLALKETKQLEKKESDALILEQFYQHKDFPPRPLGEKAWQPYQKLLHKWLSSILELKQENPALHTSFQTSLCEMRIYGSHLTLWRQIGYL